MEQLKTGHIEFASQIANHWVVTEQIRRDRLAAFLRAALATGFRVEEIAKEGEEFPFTSGKPVRHNKLEVFMRRVKGEDCIAVSVEKPKAVENHFPFWRTVAEFEQEEGYDPSDSKDPAVREAVNKLKLRRV